MLQAVHSTGLLLFSLVPLVCFRHTELSALNPYTFQPIVGPVLIVKLHSNCAVYVHRINQRSDLLQLGAHHLRETSYQPSQE